MRQGSTLGNPSNSTDNAVIDPALTRENIEATHRIIAPHIRRTPVIEVDGADFGLAGLSRPSMASEALGLLPGIALVLKLEFLQHAGSFKARGAFTHMLTRDVPAAGIVAASGGNHGAATAFAAARSGHRATIFVPTVASKAKVDQIRDYGADLRIEGDRYADALAASEQFAEQTGALRVHAYDQVETLLGQGTVALEFETQAPELDAVLVAVGGGGLIGGMAAWYRGRTRLVAVEPENAPALAMALQAGTPVDAPVSGVAADSLGAKRVGTLMFPLAQQFVDAALLVSDEAIVQAQHALWKNLRIVVEPGGAAALAAVLSGVFETKPGQRIGILLCGANTSAVQFPASAM
jgi:threonine dehydratase